MAFEFRHQPFKTIYILGSVLIVLFIRLPLWSVTFLVPAWRPRRSWTFGRAIIINLIRTFGNILLRVHLPSPPSAADARATPGYVVVEAAPELVTGEIRDFAEINGVQAAATSGYWYSITGPSDVAHKAFPGEKVLLYFHDGGHILGTAHSTAVSGSKDMMTRLLSHLPDITRGFACEFRLASTAPFPTKNGFPASLLDAVACYKYLVRNLGFAPENIIVAGDSSGGHIAVNLVRYLALSAFPGIGIPCGLVLLSPTVDWGLTHTGPNSSMVRNLRSDIVESVFAFGFSRGALLGRLPASAAATNAWISPASLALGPTEGLFRGLPPTLIAAGEAEQTLDPMRTLRDRLEADLGSANVTYREYLDSSHNPIRTFYDPKRETVLQDIGEWAKGLSLRREDIGL